MSKDKVKATLDIVALMLAIGLASMFVFGCTTTPSLDPDNSSPTIITPLEEHRHQASFLFDNAATRVMNILSPSYPEEKFKKVVDRCIANGDTEIYLYLINERDGEWANYSFYKNNDIGGDINYDTVDFYNKRLDYVIGKSLSPILWLRADDSSHFNSISETRQKKYQEDAVKLFEERATAFCLGLELNEYFSVTQIKTYYDHLDGLTDLPIGIHLTSLSQTIVKAIKPKRFYGQFGFGKTVAQVYKDTKNIIPAIAPTEFYGAEYHKSSDSEEAKNLGDSILDAGALGVGNGAH